MIQTMLRYGQNRINFDLPKCIAGDPVLPKCWKLLVQAEQELNSANKHKKNDRSNLVQKIEGLSQTYQSGKEAVYIAQYGSSLRSLISSLSTTKKEKLTKLDDVRKLLANIDCTDSIMNVTLPIMKEYIKYLESEDKSTFDYSRLIGFSRLCADEYGPYIHLARGLVYNETDEYYDQYDDCRTQRSNPRSLTRDEANHAKIYPNPSTGLSTLDFGQVRSGKIKVIDISGHTILETDYDETSFVTLDLSDHIGINMIFIYHKDGTIETLRHITIK